MEQLIEYFTPENYQLNFRINKHIERLYGKVTITGIAHGETIKFHAEGLVVTSVEVNDSPVSWTHEFGTINIDMSSLKQAEQKEQACRVSISYHTKLQRNMEGAYLSTYEYEGKEERIVATQFESHYARNCFPCIDEPAAKATFDLKITTPDLEDDVISNMPIEESRVVEHPAVTADLGLSVSQTAKKKIVTFKQTPRMSTYLLAFVLGRFHHKSIKTSQGTKVTTYCALNQDPKTLTYPNRIAAAAIEYYNNKFGIDYPLPKLDQVALPDFEAGAMENWGLVTYRESCLLAYENSPLESKEYIATVIAHELSHQWFGNLVTMKWWDDLWLNESFATVMEYICTDEICPEYNIWEKFFTGECLAALTRDAYPGVQAVKQPVHDPAEIATLFDSSIVYAKGAHLMFMLLRLMGKKQFFAGLKKYFKKYKYSNTTGDDLWSSLQEYAKFDVREFMGAWVSQPGYPVITDGVQQRFLITGGVDDTKWPLPEIKDDMSGHYLLNLSGEEFTEKLKIFNTLSLEQRYRLLIDRMLLSETPLVSAASLLDLLPEFREEDSKPIWDILTTIMNKLKLFAPGNGPDYANYREYIRQIVLPTYKKLGLKHKNGEKSNDTKLRPIILGLMLYSKDEDTIKALAKLYRDDYDKLPAETRYAVLTAELMLEEDEYFDKYVSAYQESVDPDLRSDLLAAIACIEHPKNTKKLLKLLEQPEIVRPQDHIYLYAYLMRNIYTKDAALSWLYTHWDYVKEITGDKSLDDYARISTRAVHTLEESDAFFAFFDPLSNDPAFTRTISVAHQEISARLRWLKLDQEDFSKKLKKSLALF